MTGEHPAGSECDQSARLLRSSAKEIARLILPNLTSGEAIDKALFLQGLLEYLAADIDVVADLAADAAPRFRSELASVLAAVPADFAAAEIADYRARLAAVPREHGLAAQREIAALRALTAGLIRTLSSGGSWAAAAVTRLGALDYGWLRELDRAKRATKPGSSAETGGEAALALLTVEAANAYFRRAFPASPDIAVTNIAVVPGGRSKRTYMLDLTGTDALPKCVVMRQDMALKYVGTTVRDEYKPLRIVSELGIPAPRPLHFEPEVSEAGSAFILVERMAGEAPGDYFNLRVKSPEMLLDLARMLARLHTIDIAAFGADTAREPLVELIERSWKIWRENSTRHSGIIDFACAWAARACAEEPGIEVFVHGDIGPHNLMAAEGRLLGVLDWEFAHISDSAEDLGIVRSYAESVMPWQRFMEAYRAAGGPAISDKRVRLGQVVQMIKGASWVARSGRNFIEGGTDDFIKGANALVVGLRQIEMRLAGLLGAEFG